MRSTRISGSSTAAVLWMMILLVFLPIAAGHLIARQMAEPAPRSGAAQEQVAPRAG